MPNEGAYSISLLLPKPTVGLEALKKFNKELLKDVAPAVVSSAPTGFGQIALAKEPFQNEDQGTNSISQISELYRIQSKEGIKAFSNQFSWDCTEIQEVKIADFSL
ncbi:hypothetical protein GH714_031765 [Hevea brasiliensis]|uniref:Uncharacterized protein n=1 Tax=Hevea brasiliensis TaxID=3981 RepID=A0A6A6L4E3_HEVBR|nr:hypothetical protein GH714_031765 [Hevea brasiliensis]